MNSTQSKAVFLALALAAGTAQAGGSTFACPCKITSIRLYQNSELAVIYTDAARSNVPACVGTHLLAPGLLVSAKDHPSVFAAILTAHATEKPLQELEGNATCSLIPGTEDLNQVVF